MSFIKINNINSENNINDEELKFENNNNNNLKNKISNICVDFDENGLEINVYNKKIPNQPVEQYYGNREYKRYIMFDEKNEKKTNIKLNKRSTQLLFRLKEGNGKALYIIGLEDSGIVYGINVDILLISITNIIKMIKIINCKIKNINVYRGINGYISSIRIIT